MTVNELIIKAEQCTSVKLFLKEYDEYIEMLEASEYYELLKSMYNNDKYRNQQLDELIEDLKRYFLI